MKNLKYRLLIKDLTDLNKNNLQVREDKVKGIYIEDLTEHIVEDSNSVFLLMNRGNRNRSVNSTNMNEASSRSHSIFVINIIQNNLKDLSAKSGKLFLVDLAGSEKISKTGAVGTTLGEAKYINKSLTTLGLVINNLTDGKSNHIPYRDSKLTRILQESLGGNSKTSLIATLSTSVFNEAESLSTLRFASRAKVTYNNIEN
jgi:kinesin family protein 5